MSFSIENILDKVIFCTRLYPGYPGNMPIKNTKPGGLNTRLIGHLKHESGAFMPIKRLFKDWHVTTIALVGCQGGNFYRDLSSK